MVDDNRRGDFAASTIAVASVVPFNRYPPPPFTVKQSCVPGLEAYRTCQSGDIAARNVVQMIEKYRVLSDDTQDVNSTTPLLGNVAQLYDVIIW